MKSIVRTAIQRGNREVGGSVIEMGEAEYMIRATGYLKSPEDLAVALYRKLGIPPQALPILNLRWLGMLDEVDLGAEKISPLPPAETKGRAMINGSA